jgi:hypothetical protein
MAYDTGLAQRIRDQLRDRTDVVEKKMFGGVCYLLHGNMSCGVHKDRLIVRVGPEKHQDALSREHTGEFDITGRPMKGWVTVEPEGYESDEDLESWVGKGLSFALTLPAK